MIEQTNPTTSEQMDHKQQTLVYDLADEAATVTLGNTLSTLVSMPCVIYLYGELGAGKTTFVRGLLQGLGHEGAVKSPTYTLVEPYRLKGQGIYHFDLYRLADPEELEFIGIREYQEDDSLLIFEWPDQGAGMIPEADMILTLAYQGEARQVTFRFGNSTVGLELEQKVRQKLGKN